MTKGKRKIIGNFLEYYFKTRRSQYSAQEIPQNKELIEFGILRQFQENTDVLEIVKDCPDLQQFVLEIAESKLSKKLPSDISDAFKFIDDFESCLKKEYDCERIINSFEVIIKGFTSYVFLNLYEQGIDIIDFISKLDHQKKREHHLFSFERKFLKFLPLSKYSTEQIFEILTKLWQNQHNRSDIIMSLREFPKVDIQKSKQLLQYSNKQDDLLLFSYDLLIGMYNAGEISILENIIQLKDKNFNACLSILGRIEYLNGQDIERAFSQIGNLSYDQAEIAGHQSYLIRNIIENKNTQDIIFRKAINLYSDFLQNSTDEIVNIIFQDISCLDQCEAEKYQLLYMYLNKTGNFGVIKQFFYGFTNPKYIFDIMMKLFSITPDFCFSIDLFESGIIHSWNSDQINTEKYILDLFKQHSAFGILAVKVLFVGYTEILYVDLLKLEKAEYQITAINSIVRYPHSFDKLLPLLLPLRNSMYKEVREYLQKEIAQKVFFAYHGTVFNLIQENISNSKEDKAFLKPIRKALTDYNKLKELKASINDLNPEENERDLMDLYYRLEHEQHAKAMNEANQGKGTFLEMVKSSIIVRGNSFKFDDREPTLLAKIESSMLIDGSSYLNPDLYEHNLNILK